MMKFVDGFCIDSTEVTGQQYEEFVNAAVDVQSQSQVCLGNTSFTPQGGWPVATDAFNKPVTYVDWCDAYAYCKWAGKRLCGKIGGGSNAYGDFVDATRSQWYDVCSNGGRNTYPYGGTWDPLACNGYDGPDGCNGSTSFGNCTLDDVGTHSKCQGVLAYAGVFDMSGNAMEWEDSCEPDPDGGPVDNCRLRGGSIYALGESDMACNADSWDPRSDALYSIGFRCCYDPP